MVVQSGEDLSDQEMRRAWGIRIAGIGFLLIVLNGIVDILWWNVLLQLLIPAGIFLIVFGLWSARTG